MVNLNMYLVWITIIVITNIRSRMTGGTSSDSKESSYISSAAAMTQQVEQMRQDVKFFPKQVPLVS